MGFLLLSTWKISFVICLRVWDPRENKKRAICDLSHSLKDQENSDATFELAAFPSLPRLSRRQDSICQLEFRETDFQ